MGAVGAVGAVRAVGAGGAGGRAGAAIKHYSLSFAYFLFGRGCAGGGAVRAVGAGGAGGRAGPAIQHYSLSFGGASLFLGGKEDMWAVRTVGSMWAGGGGCSGGGVGAWVAREGRGAVGGRGVAVPGVVCA